VSFSNAEDSHNHSLETLNLLNNYQEFMESIESMVDMGCGKHGKDITWWSNAHLLDDNDNKVYYNIDCYGVDIEDKFLPQGAKNISFLNQDFEKTFSKRQFDLVWCHDAFQYAINPIETLKNWWGLTNDSGMICIQVPTTVNIKYNRLSCSHPSYTYFNYTVDTLIHMLAVNGFDCKDGYFKEDNEWVKAIAYKSDIAPMDPRKTSWYDLVEKDLLPDSVAHSVNKYGYPKREELVLTWLQGTKQILF